MKTLTSTEMRCNLACARARLAVERTTLPAWGKGEDGREEAEDRCRFWQAEARYWEQEAAK